MSSSEHLQLRPAAAAAAAALVRRLTWMLWVIGAVFLCDAAASLCSSHLDFSLSTSLGSRRAVQPYSSTDTATDWMNSRFILSVRSDIYMVDNNLSMADHAFFLMRTILTTSLSVDEILLPSYLN